MPELPEVETIRRQLEPVVLQRRIVDIGAFDNHRFSEALLAKDGRITSISRRGKYLLMDLEPARATGKPTPRRQQSEQQPGQQLVVHLGMTGRLTVATESPGSDRVDNKGAAIAADLLHPHLRAWWRLEDDTTGSQSILKFHDIRRFGRVSVVEAGKYESLPTLNELGPEPLDGSFTPQHLIDAMGGRRMIKSVLLGQRAVAGVGNIYADEALWLAGIRPSTRRLGAERAAALHAAIIEVLEEGLADGGTTLKDYRNIRGEGGTHQHRLHVYGQAGETCKRCGSILQATRIDGRGTTWCPTCQR